MLYCRGSSWCLLVVVNMKKVVQYSGSFSTRLCGVIFECIFFYQVVISPG
jgi:hypothetical protein